MNRHLLRNWRRRGGAGDTIIGRVRRGRGARTAQGAGRRDGRDGGRQGRRGDPHPRPACAQCGARRDGGCRCGEPTDDDDRRAEASLDAIRDVDDVDDPGLDRYPQGYTLAGANPDTIAGNYEQ